MSKTGKCRWILMSVLVMIMAICMAFGLTACNTDDDAETPEGPALDNSPADDKGGTGDNSQTEDNNETDDKDEASSDKPLGTPVISYVYDANTVTLTQTKETADSLQITAESGDGYEIAEVTASVNGEVVYRAKRENNNYIIPANELAEGAVITLSAVSENAEVKENKVSYYYSQSAETPYLVEGYDNLAEARAAVPAQSEYFNFVNWIEADTDNGLALVADWTLDEKAIATGITLEITHETADETYANAKVVVKISEDLTKEVANHGATISALGVVFANNSSAGFTSEDIALKTSKDGEVIYPWEAEENMESARFSQMNSGESARLDGYYWANVYGSITMNYKIKAENLKNRFFTPWVVISSGETDNAVQGDGYDGESGRQHSTVIDDIYNAILGGNGVLSVYVRGSYIKTDDINNTELKILNGEETVFSCKPTSVSGEGTYYLTFKIADKLAELQPEESTDYAVTITVAETTKDNFKASGAYVANNYDYILSLTNNKTILTVKPIPKVTEPVDVSANLSVGEKYGDVNIRIDLSNNPDIVSQIPNAVTAVEVTVTKDGGEPYSNITIYEVYGDSPGPKYVKMNLGDRYDSHTFEITIKYKNADGTVIAQGTVTLEPDKSLKLDHTSLTLELGEDGTATATVTATVLGNVSGEIAWSIDGSNGITIEVSADKTYVTVTATAEGEATVKATVDDIVATCAVKVVKQGEVVEEPPVDVSEQLSIGEKYGDVNIRIDLNNIEIADQVPNGTGSVEVTVAKDGGEPYSNITIYEVYGGPNGPKFIKMNLGDRYDSHTFVITVKYKNSDGKVIAQGTVKLEPEKSLKLDHGSLDIELDEDGTATATLTATVLGNVDGTIEWSIEGDNGIEIQVNEDKMSVTIKATAEGSATIKATVSGLTASCEVKVFKKGEVVEEPPVDVSSQLSVNEHYGDVNIRIDLNNIEIANQIPDGTGSVEVTVEKDGVAVDNIIIHEVYGGTGGPKFVKMSLGDRYDSHTFVITIKYKNADGKVIAQGTITYGPVD